MDRETRHLIDLINNLENDNSWPWPPIMITTSEVAEKEAEIKLQKPSEPLDPIDISTADKIYTQFYQIWGNDNQARLGTKYHLHHVLGWSRERAEYTTAIAVYDESV